MQNKNIQNILKIGTGVTVIILFGCFLYIRALPETRESIPQNNEETFVEEKYEDSAVVGGYKSYINTTAGFSFKYPADWKLKITEDDYSIDDFYAFLFPPLWGQNGLPEIVISKKLSGKAGDEPMISNAYDNLGIEEQIKTYDDCKRMKLCELATNKNGVKYFRHPDLIQCDDNEGCLFWSSFPTGKYVMHFSMLVYAARDELDNYSLSVDTFNKIIDSVKLE